MYVSAGRSSLACGTLAGPPCWVDPSQVTSDPVRTDAFGLLRRPSSAARGARYRRQRRRVRDSLLTYGIEDPELFLGGVKGNLCTVRLDHQGDRQLLIARVGDQSKVIDVFQGRMGFMKKNSTLTDTNVFENSEGSTSAAINDSIVVVGHPADVQQYFRIAADSTKIEKSSQPQRITHFAGSPALSSVVTYTNDDDRVRACIVSILSVSGGELSSALDSRIASLPYAATDTSLSEEGLTRITRSSMGQFSTIIPLLIPERVLARNETRETP